MDYITSRRFALPDTAADWQREYHFNLWRSRQWPYAELNVGDHLYWYESPRQVMTWVTRVAEVDRFEYDTLGEALSRMTDRFGSLNEDQPYVVGAPESGYCLVYRSETPRRLNDIPRPEGFRMPMLGWQRLDPATRRVWGL